MNIDNVPIPEFANGSVWLVGAGPGDPGLLTLHAAKAISEADIIIHDALVSTAILELAPAGTELVPVGKRGGRPSPKQAEISSMLIAAARRERKVVRLKGGDPFVFGRGAEEALALVEAEIPFHVIPGITAGIGGLAAAGIPVTHGTINQSVTFLTGHDPQGDIPDGLDWDALAKSGGVLVFYMAVRHMPAIAARLMAAGRAPSQSVAFVRNASLPDQQVTECCLSEVTDLVNSRKVASPSIVVIGEVVHLRHALTGSHGEGVRLSTNK